MNIFFMGFNLILHNHEDLNVRGKKAYVNAYYPSDNIDEAIEMMIKKIEKDGYEIIDMNDTAYRMDSSQWEIHVADNWEDLSELLYSQSEFDELVLKKKVIYGPFAYYDEL